MSYLPWLLLSLNHSSSSEHPFILKEQFIWENNQLVHDMFLAACQAEGHPWLPSSVAYPWFRYRISTWFGINWSLGQLSEAGSEFS